MFTIDTTLLVLVIAVEGADECDHTMRGVGIPNASQVNDTTSVWLTTNKFGTTDSTLGGSVNRINIISKQLSYL